ncbi:unnamed protein product [Trichogramma brassicae]|uniref:CHK kinase-like domain-containing protein n=1 Tax=Trichogramma brassicae TaxID=86971 RepID=A0A6H5JAV7_9HYME|nr:unnamed protein product [Trichogramma brassicae]
MSLSLYQTAMLLVRKLSRVLRHTAQSGLPFLLQHSTASRACSARSRRVRLPASTRSPSNILPLFFKSYTEASIGKCKTQTNKSNDYDDKKYEREAEEETGERRSERTTRKRRFARRFNTLDMQYRVRYYTCILSRDSQARRRRRRRRRRVHVVKEELPKQYHDDRRTFVLLYTNDAYALVLLHLQDIRVTRADLLFTISRAAAGGAPNTDPELFCRQGRLTHYLFEPPTPPLMRTNNYTFDSLQDGDNAGNNIMFNDEGGESSCILVDFQLLRYASPAVDIHMFLYLNTTLEYRKTNEILLFKHYYSVFSETLVKNSSCYLKNSKSNWTKYFQIGPMRNRFLVQVPHRFDDLPAAKIAVDRNGRNGRSQSHTLRQDNARHRELRSRGKYASIRTRDRHETDPARRCELWLIYTQASISSRCFVEISDHCGSRTTTAEITLEQRKRTIIKTLGKSLRDFAQENATLPSRGSFQCNPAIYARVYSRRCRCCRHHCFSRQVCMTCAQRAHKQAGEPERSKRVDKSQSSKSDSIHPIERSYTRSLCNFKSLAALLRLSGFSRLSRCAQRDAHSCVPARVCTARSPTRTAPAVATATAPAAAFMEGLLIKHRNALELTDHSQQPREVLHFRVAIERPIKYRNRQGMSFSLCGIATALIMRLDIERFFFAPLSANSCTFQVRECRKFFSIMICIHNYIAPTLIKFDLEPPQRCGSERNSSRLCTSSMTFGAGCDQGTDNAEGCSTRSVARPQGQGNLYAATHKLRGKWGSTRHTHQNAPARLKLHTARGTERFAHNVQRRSKWLRRIVRCSDLRRSSIHASKYERVFIALSYAIWRRFAQTQ